MSFIKPFIFLFLFICLTSHNLRGISIPDKDSFVPLKHGEKTLIELTPTKRELYFSFDNQFDNSDIAVYVKFAHQYTVGMYFYDAYEKIKTDDQGEYINFDSGIDMSEKFSYIKESKNCTYYIVIKDSGNYTSKDYITIFNEKDTLELKEDEPFLIRMFFQNNLYTFTFTGEQDDKIEIDMNIDNTDFSESLIIYKDEKEIQRSVTNKGVITISKGEEKGNYKILLISTNDEIYKNIKSSIVLRKSKNVVRLIEPEKELNIHYGYTKEFSFYLDIDDYELNDENIITFKISHSAYKNKLVKYCYAKNMNFEKFDDNKFITNMPCHEDESESYFNRLNSLDTIYHLYFARTQAKEEGKKSFLLVHCSVKSDDDKYYDPEKISIYLSNKPKLLDFTTTKKLNEKIKIKEYVPMLYRVKIPTKELPEDNKYSYAFYTNVKIQTFYENSMLNAKYKYEEVYQLYGINNSNLKNEQGKDKIYYIKIFGAEQEINFRAEATKGEIYFTSGKYRYYKTFTQQHLNCGNSFYFIGTYSLLVTDTFFFMEEIYGKFDIYYKNEITDSDDDTILTNGNSKYLVNGKSGSLTKTFDIIELKCQSPGYFNLHILKSSFTDTLVLYQRQVAVVNKGELSISLENAEQQKDVNLEISTPLGKEIDIITYDKTIDSTNRFFQIKYNDTTFTNTCKLNIKEDNTIISIRLTDETLYDIVDGASAKSNEEYILFKLKNEQTYKSVNITINKISDYHAYTLFKGDINYAEDMLKSGYKTISADKSKNSITLILSNPYMKINQMISDKEDSPFYISFYVKDTEGKQKDITVVYNDLDKHEEWENSVVRTLPSDPNQKYNIKVGQDIKKLSVLYQSCGKSLKEVNIFNYDDILNSFENNNKINLGIFNNYLIDDQLGPIFSNDPDNKYPGAQISLSLKEISQKEIDDLNDENINYISQDGTVLTWSNLNGAKEYTLYVFNAQNENIKYIENICYLDLIKKNKLNIELKDETDPTYIGIYTTTTNTYDVKEKGIFYITVVANLENSYPLNYVFHEIKYNSTEPPKPTPEPTSNNLGLILGICIPLVAIIIIIVVVIIVKKRKNRSIDNLPTEDNDSSQALVRPTDSK